MEPSERSRQIGANISVAVDVLIGAHLELAQTPIPTPGRLPRVSRERVVAVENVQQARARLEEILANVVDGLEGQL